jgi:hypothetical protein
MNSATPFGYPSHSPGNLYNRFQGGGQGGGGQGVRQRPLFGTRSYTAEQAEGMQQVRPQHPYQMGVKLPFNVMQQMFPNFYNFDQQVHPLQHLNIPGGLR